MKKHALTYAFVGILAAVVGIAVGEFVASLFNSAYAPIQVVASSAIDIPPAPVKEWATATFGTAAKSVVVGTVVAAVIVLAALAGIVARTRLGWGVALALLIGVVGAVAGLARPNDDLLAPLPSLIAGITAAVALTVMMRALQHTTEPAPLEGSTTRRTVLIGATAVVGSGILLGLARWLTNSTTAAVSRISAMLPTPTEALPPIPQGVQAPVPGLTPFITPNNEFYRIDTAVVVPQVNPDTWTLTIDGMVDRSLTLTYAELLALPMVERDITLMCVSNPVGGGYISNARWLGTPLMPLLQEAGIQSSADQLFSESVDGWTCSTPLEGLALREPLLVVGMNGEPLPVDHGYPVRMVIPGLYGYISATKWLSKITATTYQAAPAYWTVRGWATEAPVLTGSRADLPEGPSPLGVVNIAGIAWAMDGNGISDVEVQVDDGPWQRANLAEQLNEVTWRQWWLPWEGTPGEHLVRVRATNGLGQVQTAEQQDPFPSGATGYDSRYIFVEG